MSKHQASACMTLMNIQLVKASHMAKHRSHRRGLYKDVDTRGVIHQGLSLSQSDKDVLQLFGKEY